MAQPVADAERAEFGEISVVENQDEQAILAADTLDRMTVTARKIPHVTRREIDDLGMVVRIKVDSSICRHSCVNHLAALERSVSQLARTRKIPARRWIGGCTYKSC